MNTHPPPKNNGIICRPAHFHEIILYLQNNLSDGLCYSQLFLNPTIRCQNTSPGGQYVLDHSMHDPKIKGQKRPLLSSNKNTGQNTSPGGHYVLDHSMHDPKSRVKKDPYSDLSWSWNKTLTETNAIHWWDTLTPTFFWDRYSNVMMPTHNISLFII